MKDDTLDLAFIEKISNDFKVSIGHFYSHVLKCSQSSDQAGSIDPLTAYLLEMAEKLYEDAKNYYESGPDNKLRALAWLQSAFLVCRAFESEQLVEPGKKPYRVGSQLVPDRGSRKWEEETSASTAINQHLNHGTFTFNFELHERLAVEINAKRCVHALVLICDAPKHGVMSPLLNLIHPQFISVEDIYLLGFEAVNISIKAFCEENNITQ